MKFWEAMKALEELIETFERHTKEAAEYNEGLLKQFIENNPGKAIPSHFFEPFKITEALRFMCEEILKLKERVRNLE